MLRRFVLVGLFVVVERGTGVNLHSRRSTRSSGSPPRCTSPMPHYRPRPLPPRAALHCHTSNPGMSPLSPCQSSSSSSAPSSVACTWWSSCRRGHSTAIQFNSI